MSQNQNTPSTPDHEAAHEAHTGPVKTPTQLLWASAAAIVLPIFIIIGLANYVTSDTKISAGLSAKEAAAGADARIAKVGIVEIRDANRELKSGEAVYKAQCMACHGAGVAGAPKFGDKAAWSARLGQGFEKLVSASLLGKGAMGAQGGGDFDDLEIARAVAYMGNAAGGKFTEPNRPGAEAKAEPVKK